MSSLWMLPGNSHRDSLSCERYLLSPLIGNSEENKELMVLRVRPTPTFFISRWTVHPRILYQMCDARQELNRAWLLHLIGKSVKSKLFVSVDV